MKKSEQFIVSFLSLHYQSIGAMRNKIVQFSSRTPLFPRVPLPETLSPCITSLSTSAQEDLTASYPLAALVSGVLLKI